MTVGERLKMLRTELHMSMEDVASQLGVQRPTVFRYETGMITNIPPENIERLAEIFNVTPQYIMGWSDSRVAVQVHEEEHAIRTKEASTIAHGIDQMPTGKRQQAMSLLRIAFPEYAHLFTVEEDDVK